MQVKCRRKSIESSSLHIYYQLNGKSIFSPSESKDYSLTKCVVGNKDDSMTFWADAFGNSFKNAEIDFQVVSYAISLQNS